MVLDGHIHLAKVVVESSHSRPSFDIICVLFCSSSFYLVQSNHIPNWPASHHELCNCHIHSERIIVFKTEFLALAEWVGLGRARTGLRMATGFRRFGFFYGASRILGLQGTAGRVAKWKDIWSMSTWVWVLVSTRTCHRVPKVTVLLLTFGWLCRFLQGSAGEFGFHCSNVRQLEGCARVKGRLSQVLRKKGS